MPRRIGFRKLLGWAIVAASWAFATYASAGSAKAPYGVPLSPRAKQLQAGPSPVQPIAIFFKKNQAGLDAEQRLGVARAVKASDPQSTFLVEGFTDKDGRADLNKRVAADRVELIADELRKVKGTSVAVEQVAYGSEHSVGTTSAAKARERVVLVWVIKATPPPVLAPAPPPLPAPPPKDVAIAPPPSAPAHESERWPSTESERPLKLNAARTSVKLLYLHVMAPTSRYSRAIYAAPGPDGERYERGGDTSVNLGLGLEAEVRRGKSHMVALGARYLRYAESEAKLTFESQEPRHFMAQSTKAQAVGIWMDWRWIVARAAKQIDFVGGTGFEVETSAVTMSRSYEDTRVAGAEESADQTNKSNLTVVSTRIVTSLDYRLGKANVISLSPRFIVPLWQMSKAEIGTGGSAGNWSSALGHRAAAGAELVLAAAFAL